MVLVVLFGAWAPMGPVIMVVGAALVAIVIAVLAVVVVLAILVASVLLAPVVLAVRKGLW